jgi:hypothetical protein
VIFKFRLGGKKQAEWLLHDLAQMGHGLFRNKLQAVCDPGFAGTACGKDGAFFLQIQGLKPLDRITRSRWDREEEGILLLNLQERRWAGFFTASLDRKWNDFFFEPRRASIDRFLHGFFGTGKRRASLCPLLVE